MDSTKYVGMDVHKDTMSIAVMNSAGKVVMESVLETKAVTILQFIQGLRGNLLVTLEEGTWAAWLYDTAFYSRPTPGRWHYELMEALNTHYKRAPFLR